MTSYADNFSKLTSTKFDYIVVGGGTAGLPLAVRLSELPNVAVVVLEAGENIVDDPTIQIPANCLKVPNQEKYDWLIKTAPQEHLDNRVLNVSRGKMLGGTSNMNYMGYDRASKAEYDAWDRLTDGKTKWNWDAIVSSFKSAERFDPSSSPEDPLPSFSRSDADISYLGMTKEESIGTNGPLKLCYNDVYSDVAESYVKAINSLGVPTIANPLGGEKCGIYNALRTVDYTQGTRISSLDAYLMQAEGRENLTVLTGAHVTKINLNSDDGHDLLASGVEFVIGKEHLRVEASKEVILCAGSILTPALLELSGIGDSARLRSLGIDTLVDLPGVGENLQDHTFAPVQFQLHPHIKTLDWLRNDPKFLKEQLKLYETAKRGWMTMLESIPAFFPFKQIVDESTYTSVISNLKNTIESQKAAGLLSPAQEAHFAIQVEWLERGDVPSAEIWFLSGGMIAPEPGESYLTFIAGNQHPFSRGTVHITSTDPMSPPSVDPKFLSTDFDMEAHIAVYRMAEKLADTEPLKGIIKARSTPSTVLDGQALQDYIRQTAWSGGHYFGTAMMARRGLGSVVSSDLKVHGTRNLRVADSSIIPLPLASHIQATVYMIAEKAAEIIKTASRE